MVDRALWRISTPDEQRAKAERQWAQAVAEVDGYLSGADDEPVDVLDQWVMAGGEVAG